MPDLHTESRTRALFVAFLVCAVCSLVVSSTAVFLAPQQRANLEREREQKIVEIIQSQPGLTCRPASSMSQVPSPWPVTANALVRAARSGTSCARSRSTAAASSQVRAMSCSTAPSGRSS